MKKCIVNKPYLLQYSFQPLSEEFELSANSLGAHIETQGKLILRTFSELTVNSQAELTL